MQNPPFSRFRPLAPPALALRSLALPVLTLSFLLLSLLSRVSTRILPLSFLAHPLGRRTLALLKRLCVSLYQPLSSHPPIFLYPTNLLRNSIEHLFYPPTRWTPRPALTKLPSTSRQHCPNPQLRRMSTKVTGRRHGLLRLPL